MSPLRSALPLHLLLLLGSGALGELGNLELELVEAWSSRLGVELWAFGNVITRRQEMQESFKDAKVISRDGQELVSEIARDIKNMMELKISAVKRIMDTAETLAEASKAEGTVSPLFEYKNSKNLNTSPNNTVDLKENNHFFGFKVNTSFSAVHVPTNVYDRSPEVIHGIKWSEKLDEIFISNYRQDPSLSWQYFGSSTGFMRQYPAMKWEQKPSGPVDLFDCRTRAWYIEAATSPKDILILVDNSGSMMGQRREIARHVVNNILDTLGSNDFVNVLTFIKNATEVVPCFAERLVQANLANIRELKIGMENLEPASNIANFSVALTTAFQLLEMYRMERRGSACNQAIMLVTDGVPYNFQEIFQKWNWGELPKMPVRVFTYLIGREVADVREVKWMACANRGYYVHLSTMAEVREQVLHYVSVMARPLVLNKTHHPVIWTPVYADIVDPKMTDWLWEMKEKEKQKEISLMYKKSKKPQHMADDMTQDERDDKDYMMYTKYNQNIKLDPYKMMTSVSMPVYDRRENATKIANLLGVAGTDVPNSAIERLMVPHMLGVNAYAFIVTNNGYILIHPDLRPVTSVGTPLMSDDTWFRVAPDIDVSARTLHRRLAKANLNIRVSSSCSLLNSAHRATCSHFCGEQAFDGILKPSYNNIDFTDVELIFENETEIIKKLVRKEIREKEEIDQEDIEEELEEREKPREREESVPCRKDDPRMLLLRERLINHKNGSTVLPMKNHYDGLRRVSVGKRHYYYTFINGTPFELVVALPNPYGLNRVEAQLEVKRLHVKGKKVTEFFGGRNWKIHPDWYYCKYHYGDNFKSPEEEILHFLSRSSQPGWKWPPFSNLPPESHHSCNSCNSSKDDNMDKSTYYCDRTLLLSLVYDAKVTEWFSGNISLASGEEKGQDMKQRFGLVLVFMATRTGLTRWQDITTNSENETESGSQHFSNVHNKAIDETWYKRAVEQYYVDPNSFVYSVPFDAGEKNDSLVTATHAVFHSDKGREAPAAVVGFQFHHSALHALFKNITSSCEKCDKTPTCANDAYACYLLDNNGYIVVSEAHSETGRFFGEVQGAVMEKLIEDEIYKKIPIYDYQAVCFATEGGEKSNSCKLKTPVAYFGWLISWVTSNLLWILIQTNLQWLAASAYSYTTGDGSFPGYDDPEPPNQDIPTGKNDKHHSKLIINRTRPQPCDMKVNLFLLDMKKVKNGIAGIGCSRPYVIKDVLHSNLIMVVVNSLCPLDKTKTIKILPKEVNYDEELCCKSGRNLSRKNVAECANFNEKENKINNLCGSGTRLSPPTSIIISSMASILFRQLRTAFA